jgi:uncharacterized membrane protein
MRNPQSGVRSWSGWAGAITALVLSAACVGMVACARMKTVTPATTVVQGACATQPAAPLDAKKIIQQRCTVCHGTFRVKVGKILPVPAHTIVDNMIKRGAVLNDDERKAVIDYLAY